MYCVTCADDEVLNQLARMKQRLQTERRRVETDFSRDQVCFIVHSYCSALCLFSASAGSDTSISSVFHMSFICM